VHVPRINASVIKRIGRDVPIAVYKGQN
jgi:hypothetical protein